MYEAVEKSAVAMNSIYYFDMLAAIWKTLAAALLLIQLSLSMTLLSLPLTLSEMIKIAFQSID